MVHWGIGDPRVGCGHDQRIEKSQHLGEVSCRGCFFHQAIEGTSTVRNSTIRDVAAGVRIVHMGSMAAWILLMFELVIDVG
jgi:hypothetical protein